MAVTAEQYEACANCSDESELLVWDGMFHDTMLNTRKRRLYSEETEMKPAEVWGRRTPLEKVFLGISVCAIIVIIALSITVGVQKIQMNQDSQAWVTPCNTKGCVDIAYETLDSIETSVDPCDDFYEFSCGVWMADRTLISSSESRFTSITESLNLKIKVILDDVNASHPLHFRKAQQLYQTCMNYTYREKLGISELVSDVAEMGGWPLVMGESWKDSEFNWIQTLKRMLSVGYDNAPLLSIGLNNDYKNNSIMRIFLLQSSLGLEDKDWFEMETVVQMYKDCILSLATAICKESSCNVSKDVMIEEISEAVALEIELAKLHVQDIVLQDYSLTYNPMTIKALQKLAPEIDWLQLIRIYFPDDKIAPEELLIVTMPKFMVHLSEILGKLTQSPKGNRTLANYMMYRQIKEASDYLDLAFGRHVADMDNFITGLMTYTDLWEQCVTMASTVFEFSIASMFVRKYIPEGHKELVVELVDRMREEFAIILNETTWMDSATKERALFKLYKVYVMSIYPDDLLDDNVVNEFYNELIIDEGNSNYRNFIEGSKFLFRINMKGLNKPASNAAWIQFPSTLLDANAFYTSQNNSIFVPIGIAHEWFFHKNAPQFSNYGRIGFVIGHELGHAFDDSGAQMDYLGNWINWWDNETKVEFEARRQCLISTFNNFTWVHDNISIPLNGTITLGENIADDVGLQESYSAYKKVNQENSPMPGLNLTADQQFWVNFAMIWCEKETPEVTELLIATDAHPPSKFRVNSPLSNSEYFIRDFGCKLGSNMNPSTSKCHVFGT